MRGIIAAIALAAVTFMAAISTFGFGSAAELTAMETIEAVQD